jgi:CDP-glucose 4,6-dehydratase
MEELAMTAAPTASFWRGRSVLITGHSGFKGSWLTLWLSRLGAHVTGISLPPHTAPNLFNEADVGAYCDSHFCDVRDAAALAARVKAARPEIVFHLAAQPLVRESYREPLATFATNVMGTANLMDALRRVDGVRVAVLATTDKVYRHGDDARAFREDDPLGGHDPYSASKAASEIVIASYRDSFLKARGVATASARAGNVIGGGDWSDDRLIPDAVRAWNAGEVLHIRRPDAVRPWQHVLEPLAGYMALAQALYEQPALADAYNFGPAAGDAVAVREVIDMARHAYGAGAVHYGDGGDGPHEAASLMLDIGKARDVLGVAPVLTLAEAVARTLAWYRAHRDGADALALCEADIAYYEARAVRPAADDQRRHAI